MASIRVAALRIAARRLMSPPAGHSYLHSGRDDDGDGEHPQLDGGKAGVSNVRHYPHAP
jgi:hypothetical protein